ncbi:hypothetical protein COS38_03610 [Candidatus Berkelbacteria bacterium CG03_land_8_20_14_0_80_40_36]|uniref:Uncharacterized protein n=1 Tax=Candidatus Berkelbacteria bacterium CG03_land_8_20_14_0_80_40_36 TaxID=1974509 RepID=A0A2M7CHG6_9BACT|nr:MAG: hypothetical protein COS38_03610 [Candidatus Berkelbacteria bacterium CG03_land_8_20_14_0_80_40_36]
MKKIFLIITEQFRLFFSKSYSKPFVIICLIVIVLGAANALYAVSNSKRNIDIQKADELLKGINKFDEDCRNKANTYSCYITGDYMVLQNECFDNKYCSLSIRNGIPPTLYLATEKFSFGWWGIIGFTAVFFLNLLIALVKFITKYVPILIRTGGAQTKSTKTNIRNMPAFQRYVLFIALATLIILILIFTKL